MSSTTSFSSTNFQSIVGAGLDSYTKQTGIDLTKHPSAGKIQDCGSLDDVLQVFSEREFLFRDNRDRYRNIINHVRPIVQVIHTVSAVLGEAIALVQFHPAKAIFVGIDILLSAATGAGASYDPLVDLFECISSFLQRLNIYTVIPLSPLMTDIPFKIMIETLSVLAPVTKQIKQGRFKKFAKKLLGESEIEGVLQRLDRLTQEEARATSASTMEVVHGHFGHLKVVIDGA